MLDTFVRETSDQPTLVDLLRALLLCIRSHRSDLLLVNLEGAAAATRHTRYVTAKPRLQQLCPDDPGDTDRLSGGLLSLLSACDQTAHPGAAALGLTQAYCDVVEDMLFEEMVLGSDHRLLRPLDVVYLDARSRKEILQDAGFRRTTRPGTLDGQIVEVRGYTLVETPAGFQVVEDWSLRASTVLADAGVPVLGVAAPNADTSNEYTWETCVHPDNPDAVAVHSVRPTPGDQSVRLATGVDRADRAGVEVLLLPELCCTGVDMNDVIHSFSKGQNLSVLIAGSAFLPDEQRPPYGRNVSTVYVRAYPMYPEEFVTLTTTKFFPVRLPAPGGGPRPVELLHPDSCTPAEIRWVRHQRDHRSVVSWTVLVCKDALHTGLQGFVCDVLRPDYVFVPSLSATTRDFKDFVNRVARGQGIALYANVYDPPQNDVDDPALAMVGRVGADALVCRLYGELLPGAWLVRPGLDARWIKVW